MIEKRCKSCGNNFNTINSRLCICEVCRNNSYFRLTKIKKCLKCNNEFQATSKQTLCKECRNKRGKGTYKYKVKGISHNFCRKCGVIIDSEIKNQTTKLGRSHLKTCKSCLLKTTEQRRLSMQLNNPQYKKPILSLESYLDIKQEKIILRKLNQEINAYKLKHNMHILNPMFSSKFRAKASETLKNRINNKEIVYIKGKEHHLFKGTRTISNYLRLFLSDWKKSVLENKNYTCENCGKQKCELHIHHLIPFRDILSILCKKLNFNLKDIEIGGDECLILGEEIKNYHLNNNIGQVLCPNCHSIIDKFYNKRKNNKNENSKDFKN